MRDLDRTFPRLFSTAKFLFQRLGTVDIKPILIQLCKQRLRFFEPRVHVCVIVCAKLCVGQFVFSQFPAKFVLIENDSSFQYICLDGNEKKLTSTFDAYVRLRLSDGSWIKMKAPGKHPDYAIVESNPPSIANGQDAKMRESFTAAIEIAERRRVECIENIHKNQITVKKLETIRQNLDLLLLQYDSGNYCQNTL